MRSIKSIIGIQVTQLYYAPTQQALQRLLKQLSVLSQQATAFEQPSSKMLASPFKKLLSSLATTLSATEFQIEHISEMHQQGAAGKSDLSLLNYINAFSVSVTLCLQQQYLQTSRLTALVKHSQTNNAMQQSLTTILATLSRDIHAIYNKYNVYGAPAPTDREAALSSKPSTANCLEANARKILSNFEALNAYLSKNITRPDEKFSLLNADFNQLSQNLSNGLHLLGKAQQDDECDRQAEIIAHFKPINSILRSIQKHLAISRHHDGKVSADAQHLIEEFRQLPGLFLLLISALTDYAPKITDRPVPPPRQRRPHSSRISAQEQPSSPSGSESPPPTPPPRARRTSRLSVSAQISTTSTSPEAETVAAATQSPSHEKHMAHLRTKQTLWQTEKKKRDDKDSKAEAKPQREPSIFF